jgi:N-acetyl-anhydromuramyl-L-alanine amidase AmpD
LLVLHSISLPPGEYGGPEVQAFFTNQLDWEAHPYFQQIKGMEVSAHFFIRRDGALLQFVSADDRAWHAGQSMYRGRSQCNDDSVGIELEPAPTLPDCPCGRARTHCPGSQARPGTGFCLGSLETTAELA